MPHDDHITAMCFRDMDELEDDSLILVTAGKDCLFKVWVILEDTDPEGKHGQSITWSCFPPYNTLYKSAPNFICLEPGPLVPSKVP